MPNRLKIFSVYAGKCVTGLLLAWVITLYISKIDFGWFLISVLLVLSPDGNDAINLALTRIKANLVGAVVGVLIIFTGVTAPLSMGIGIIVSLAACELLKLNSAARLTLASVIIILMHREGTHLWDAALGRVAAVIAGCFIGMIITYLFHTVFRIKTSAGEINSMNIKENKSEKNGNE